MDARLFAPPQPSPDHFWCEECLRWEHNAVAGEHRKPVRPAFATRWLRGVCEILTEVADVFESLSEIAQIMDNTERGLIIEAPPKETLQ